MDNTDWARTQIIPSAPTSCSEGTDSRSVQDARRADRLSLHVPRTQQRLDLWKTSILAV